MYSNRLLKLTLLGATLLPAVATSPTQAQTPWVEHSSVESKQFSTVGFLRLPGPNSILLLRQDYYARGGTEQLLIHSTDNGASWTSEAIAYFYNSSPKADHRFALDLSAVDDQNMYVLFFNLISKSRSLERSTEGVRGFKPLPAPPAGVNYIRFFNATTGICIGPADGTPQYWRIYRTTDGGITWTPISTTMPSETSESLRFSSNTLISNSVWAISNKGRILRSIDAGLTWTWSTLPFEAGAVSVDFVDALNGVALNRAGSVVRTSDGGASWQRVSAVGAVPERFLITAVPNSGGTYISRTQEESLRLPGSSITTDNGATWRTFDTQHFLFDVAIASPSRIYSVITTSNPQLVKVLTTKTSTLSNKPGKSVVAQLAWPNPSSGRLFFEPQPQARTLTLIDAIGRQQGTYTLPAQATTLTLPNPVPGLYQLQCSSGGQVLTQRLVITAP